MFIGGELTVRESSISLSEECPQRGDHQFPYWSRAHRKEIISFLTRGEHAVRKSSTSSLEELHSEKIIDFLIGGGFTNRKPSVSSLETGGRSTVRKSRFPYWGRVRASLEPKKLNTSRTKCKSSFNLSILLCVFEGRCHQVLYFTRKYAERQRDRLSGGFKAPLPTPLEPLSASTVWGKNKNS